MVFFKGLFGGADEVDLSHFYAFEDEEGIGEFFYLVDFAAEEYYLEAVVMVEVYVHG